MLPESHGAVEQCTPLFAAEVGAWQELPVEVDVDPSVLDAFLADQARSAGLDPTQPATE